MTKIKGYAIAIDFLDGFLADARVIENSHGLEVETVHHSDDDDTTNGKRRFGFVEHCGPGRPAATGLCRPVGDAFFADRGAAELVWHAIIEKIEAERACEERRKAAAEPFTIFGATISKENDETILHVAVSSASSCRIIKFTLVSGSDRRQFGDNARLASLLTAVGRPQAVEPHQLIGGMAREVSPSRFAPVVSTILAA